MMKYVFKIPLFKRGLLEDVGYVSKCLRGLVRPVIFSREEKIRT
jgi:hypothetical protein